MLQLLYLASCFPVTQTPQKKNSHSCWIYLFCKTAIAKIMKQICAKLFDVEAAAETDGFVGTGT